MSAHKPIFEELEDGVQDYPHKYKWRDILTGSEDDYGSHSVSLDLRKRDKTGGKIILGNCVNVPHDWSKFQKLCCPWMEYTTKIKNSIVKLSTCSNEISISADLGRHTIVCQKDGESKIKTSTVHPYMTFNLRKAETHKRFSEKVGVLCYDGEKHCYAAVEYNAEHDSNSHHEHKRTMDVKLHKSRRGWGLDLLLRCNLDCKHEKAEGCEHVCPYNGWSAAHPFKVKLPEIDFSANKKIDKNLTVHLGYNRPEGYCCVGEPGTASLTGTYKLNKHVTLAAQLQHSVNRLEHVAKLGAGYKCSHAKGHMNIDTSGALSAECKWKVGHGLTLHKTGHVNVRGVLGKESSGILSNVGGSLKLIYDL